jgi:hypothetical protein
MRKTEPSTFAHIQISLTAKLVSIPERIGTKECRRGHPVAPDLRKGCPPVLAQLHCPATKHPTPTPPKTAFTCAFPSSFPYIVRKRPAAAPRAYPSKNVIIGGKSAKYGWRKKRRWNLRCVWSAFGRIGMNTSAEGVVLGLVCGEGKGKKEARDVSVI